MFERVLVAFDGSEDAKEALERGLRVAGEGGRVTIASASPVLAGSMIGLAGSPDMQTDMDAAWSKQLEEVAASARDRGPEIDIRLLHGSAGPALVDELKEGDYDLCVIGTHGHTAVGALVLGSVTLHVIHASSTPTLVVRAE